MEGNGSKNDADPYNKIYGLTRCETKPQNWNIEKVEACHGLQHVTYHTELAIAFKEDCEHLLLEYATRETFSYMSFAEIWRTMNFGEILQEDDAEYLIIFIENCFFQSKKYIVFSNDLFIQVGAFYMIYSLYYKQPKRDLVKVRWTYDEHKALLKLLYNVEKLSPDFVFIYNKMKSSSAFLFVVETRRWGIEPKYAYEEKQLKDNIFGHDMNFTKIKKKIYSKDFYGIDHLAATCDEYQEGIRDYLEEHPEYKATSFFYSTPLVDDLKNNCEKFELNPKQPDPPKKEVNSIYSKRQAIKNKALKIENSDSWHRKHR